MKTTQNLIGSLMLLCCITLMGCSKQKTEVEQEVPLVMVTQPSSLHLEQKSYAGEVQARQQTALAFRVAGQVTQRFADVGDQVKVGQVLATLDVARCSITAQCRTRATGKVRNLLQKLPVMNCSVFSNCYP